MAGKRYASVPILERKRAGNQAEFASENDLGETAQRLSRSPLRFCGWALPFSGIAHWRGVWALQTARRAHWTCGIALWFFVGPLRFRGRALRMGGFAY
jgi:hypothetical protein